MEGFWSYNDWPYYSSSSNLSAFAPPFTVDKSTSNNDASAPFVDLEESTDVIPSNHFPYGYDSFSNPPRELGSTPSSKPYGYGYSDFQFSSPGLASKDAFAYGNCRDSIKPSVLESQPHYPPDISSTTPDGISSSGFSSDWSSLNHYATKSCKMEYWGQRPGLWNQSGGFNQGKSKQVEVGRGFCSEETNITGLISEEIFMNQGFQDFKGSSNDENFRTTNQMNWEKHNVPISVDKLDDKSCWWQTFKSMPVDFSSTSVQGTPLMSQETHCEPPLKLVTDSGNDHLLHTDLMLHNKPLQVDTRPSAPIAVVVKRLNFSNAKTDGALDNNNLSNTKEASLLRIAGRSVCSDIGQHHMLPDFEPTSSNNAMLSNWNVSRDVVDYVFKAGPGIQNPHANLDNLSSRHTANEGVNSVGEFLDDVDQCNLAVDSPCWKRAPAAHFHPFKASEALHPEFMKKSDESFDSNLQRPQDLLLDTENNVKISCEISNKIQIRNEINCQEKGLAGSPTKFSRTNSASEECNSDAVNSGPCRSKPSCDCGLPNLDGISEKKENIVPLDKRIYDCESRPSNAEQQDKEKNKFMSQKEHSFCHCTNVGFKMNECLKRCTSKAAGHDLSSPSVIVDAPTELETSAEKVSAPIIDIKMLVKMMHNISEVLLGHCLTDACELSERDLSVLENVIGNLCTCALKNARQTIPAQKSLFPFSDSGKLAGESLELQQNASIERPHLTKIGGKRAIVEPGNLPVIDTKNHHFAFGKEHRKISDSSHTRGDDIEIKKADKMTKDIKKILSENFHDEEGSESQTLLYKNLWLEAEANLCSINYRGRYNQMKIEMEKYPSKQRGNALDKGEQSKPEVDPKISPSQSSTTEVNSFHSAQDMPVLNAPNLREPTPEEKGNQNVDSLIQDSTVFGANKEAEGYEASVLARFHVLKSRDDRLGINTANMGDLSNSDGSHVLHTEPKSKDATTEMRD